MVREEKQLALEKELKQLGVEDADLEEHFVLGSGSGGQKMNKTHSAVRLKHLPTGIEVKCQKERSRELNRFFAKRLLIEKLKAHLGQTTKATLAQEKIKKQKKRRKRRSKDQPSSQQSE